MKITAANVYAGPNLYARFPVIRHVLDLRILEEWPTAKLGKDYIDALITSLPGLREMAVPIGSQGVLSTVCGRMKEPGWATYWNI